MRVGKNKGIIRDSIRSLSRRRAYNGIMGGMSRSMKEEIRWLDDPEVFRVGKLPAHSDHTFFRSMEEMENGQNSLRQSLDGVWKFRYSSSAAERPADFYREEYDISGFGEIAVPCHIEMAGYDKIHYINTMYPWEGHAYRRPAYALDGKPGWEGMFSKADYNPVGSYLKEFDLGEGLAGKRVFIRFEGVEQAMYVWLNGSFVGYSEDSFVPAEFELTPFLKKEGNRLAVEVHKRSTAAFLEDQDFFRFFGIFRSVSLFGRPEMHVEDLWAKPALQEDGTGSFGMELKLSVKKDCGGRAEIVLSDKEGRICLEESLAVKESGEVTGEEGGWQQVRCALPVRGLGKVHAWRHETPYRYRLLIKLYKESGELAETVPYDIGFRRIEIKNKIIYLNGKRLVINGVNRHEWSAGGGRCIGRKEMEKDMACFLANNINAVRTCHYPDQIPWYGMCDENGIYMMAETNLESHGSWQKLGRIEPSWNVPGSLPQWKGAVMDRAESNFEWFKNHVSILFWSLGNESYAGDNVECMNRYFKEKQDGRLVHYEGVVNNRAYEKTVSDVESRMYATPQDIRDYLDNEPDKPLILCEYMHDMGNSLGGMDSYMKLLEEYEMYQGGFIWDFIDQALWAEDEVTGKRVLRYGGDFDDRPSDYEFSGNGIVFADRTEKPAMQEVRFYYGKYR